MITEGFITPQNFQLFSNYNALYIWITFRVKRWHLVWIFLSNRLSALTCRQINILTTNLQSPPASRIPWCRISSDISSGFIAQMRLPMFQNGGNLCNQGHRRLKTCIFHAVVKVFAQKCIMIFVTQWNPVPKSKFFCLFVVSYVQQT